MTRTLPRNPYDPKETRRLLQEMGEKYGYHDHVAALQARADGARYEAVQAKRKAA